VKCPQCRADVPAAARFCPSCGHELVVVGDQRRMATVLFGDLVGFTALSEQMDPEQVKALVDRCFDRLAKDVEAFGGRVDKVVGDGIVALFGAPVAHEDDAERAVRAGLRMQQTVGAVSSDLDEALMMRIGVNTGEVLVGRVRAGREYTAMGDVVNTASRLQSAAEPGTVLVGPDTHAATRDIISYQSIDPVVAKGKQLPVEAWVALAAIVPPGHRPRRSGAPLVGRETELSLLKSVTSTAIDRCRAALLVIHGEAGMGKSRLAEETAAFASCEADALVLEGRCVPYGEANVWWPVAEAIRTAASITPEASVAEIDAALRRSARSALSQSGRLDELERVVAGLHHLLGVEGSLREIDVTRARDEAIRSVVAVAEGFTHRQPLLIVLSDVHWADQEVLDLVDNLLARLARRPFVLLATARRSLRERWNPNPEAANSVVLHLDPLDPEASRQLLYGLTHGGLHPSLVSMLVDRAAGNPFYLEELVALVSEAGVRTVDQLLATEAGELPSSLWGLVAARLDALATADRRVLDDAAVLGRRNKIGALVTMAGVKWGVDAETARAHVENLAAREFLVVEGDTYSFRSDVIRDVAYSTLTKADRARSHAGIAIWIEENENPEHDHVVDQIANHYAAAAELTAEIGRVGGVPRDITERALSWLTRAVEGARADSLPAVVVTLATRAIGLLGDEDDRRHRLLQLRAEAHTAQREVEAATADIEESLALASAASDEIGVARAELVSGELHQMRGEFTAAIGLLSSARRRMELAGDEGGVAAALRQQGMTYLFAGDYMAADEALRSALERFEAVGDPRGAAWARQNLAWSAYTSGRVDEAEARILEAISTFEDLGDPGGITWSRGLLAWVRFHQGHNEEAAALAESVGADAHHRGEVWGEAMMVVLTASIDLWSGRVDEAVRTLNRATALFGEIDDVFGGLQARCGLGRALIMSGEIEAGLAQLATARAAVAESEGTFDRVWFTRVATLTAAVQLGDVELGGDVTHGIDGLDGVDVVGATDRLVALALHRLQAGDHEGAVAAIDRVSEDRGYADAGRSLVKAVVGDPEGALRSAEHVAEHPHTYLDEVYAAMATALAQARLGDVDEARATLADTMSVLDATDDRLAQALVRLVDAALAERAGHDDSVSARSLAEQRLGGLGVGADGWRSLITDALGALALEA
jgi:class 3 adenylate cyclase/tetratricopeptide (TPR) repeat protein